MIAGRVSSIFAGILAVGVLALSWQVLLKNRKLSADNLMLKAAVGYPFVIRDLELDILPYLTPIVPSALPSPSAAEKVLLVAKQGCPYCVKQLPFWRDLAGSARLDGDAEIWLKSLGPRGQEFGDLEQTLASHGRASREFRVDNVAAFTLGTGIRATPTTLITRENRVQLMYAGLFTDEVRKQISSGDLLTPSVSAQFPQAGRMEAFIK